MKSQKYCADDKGNIWVKSVAQFFYFYFFLFTPDEQYTVELVQLTTTLVNKRGFI